MNSCEQTAQDWLAHRGFGGLDWASQKHNVVVVDPRGKVVEDFEIAHSALGWKKFRERMAPYGAIPFAIETSQGSTVEQLLEAGMKVYPINSKSAKSYRERKAPSGVKDDWLDAWSFADACRIHVQHRRALLPEDPLVKELRLLCRDEVELIQQRTSFICQLRHALGEYYPTALEAFEDWGSMSAWMFIQRFPTPQLLQAAGKRQWEKFLHARHLWRTESGPRRLELFAHATELCGTVPMANAKSQLALSLISMLLALEKQLGIYRRRIEELFSRHPDHDLFGSLPGAGPKLAPRLLQSQCCLTGKTKSNRDTIEKLIASQKALVTVPARIRMLAAVACCWGPVFQPVLALCSRSPSDSSIGRDQVVAARPKSLSERNRSSLGVSR